MSNLEVIMQDICDLKPYKNNARVHGKKQIQQLARSIKDFGFNVPVLTNNENQILSGHGRILAAQELNIKKIPTIKIENLNEAQQKAFILADNKIAEKSKWDKDLLQVEFEALQGLDFDFDLTSTGFETPEIDFILHDEEIPLIKDFIDKLPDALDIEKRVSLGDLWKLGEHFLYCGDALLDESYKILLNDTKANLIFTDPPYNVKINGHVCGTGNIKHSEFHQASGEMTKNEFVDFLKTSFLRLIQYSVNGSLHFICMDWRHVFEIMDAGQLYNELKNICVWNKQIGGMGSLYRSQHEFVFIFKNGNEAHINNIELGKHGRYRTNIWDYPGVSATNHHRKDLNLHPTVKPVSMIADAIKDCSNVGDIVLDVFGGSGSTILAAEKTKRKSRIIEMNSHYCDVILHRYEQMTGISPVLLKGGNDNE
jgi:DNA modification methylase